jgi:type IV fimbrial biogenesis protein FimT
MATRTQSGFTAPEMMIVVAIVGILAAIAAPNMADMVRVQRVRTAAFDVVAGLTLARSEALKRNASVTITPTGGQWGNGWTTQDTNGNVVQQQQPFSCSSCTFTGPANITYTSSGRLPAGGAAAWIGITSTNITDQSKFRCITVDLSGRPVTKTGATCP